VFWSGYVAVFVFVLVFGLVNMKRSDKLNGKIKFPQLVIICLLKYLILSLWHIKGMIVRDFRPYLFRIFKNRPNIIGQVKV